MEALGFVLFCGLNFLWLLVTGFNGVPATIFLIVVILIIAFTRRKE